MRRPIVVILSTFLSPIRSGAEACAEEVGLELSDSYDITIVTARHRRDIPKKGLLQEQVPIIRVGFGCSADKWLFPFLAPLAVRTLQPDIIHAVLESFAGIALMLCKWTSNAKRILTCQSTNTKYKGKISALWLVKKMHHSADAITVISKALQKRAAAFGRHDAIHISNGVRLKDIPQAENIFGRIIFVGRLEPMKGIDTLLKAMVDLPEHAHLEIIGDGSLRKELEIQASLLGVSPVVTFRGFIPVPDVYKEFAKADIFCGLSRTEALGNVFIEAQAAGCSVIGTNVGGIPDIIENGITGVLVPPDDPEAAHAAILKLLEEPDYAQQLAQAGRASAQKYNWSKIAEQYAEVYKLSS